jgi:hypothetical protein
MSFARAMVPRDITDATTALQPFQALIGTWATLGPDCFEVVHQLARTPGDWPDDLGATYRRRSES